MSESSTNPDSSLLQQALLYHQSGKWEVAHRIYQQILNENPNQPDALHFLGTLAFQQQRYVDAIALIERAISLEPNAAEFHAALGQVFFAQGKIDLAITSYQRAISLRHDMPDVHYNLGSALLAGGQFHPAAVSLHAAITLRPDFAEAFNNLGSAFRGMGKPDEAAGCYQQAVKLQPGNARALVNLGQIFKTLGQLDAAIACFDRAIALAPDLVDARSGKIYTLLYHPKSEASHLLWENLLWNQWHCKPLRASRRGHVIDRPADRKLRIGYVSPDFRDHVAGLYLLPLLKAHDRQRFEVYCYSNVRRHDAVTEQFAACATAFRDIGDMTDERAEQVIRDDRIDILVDTTLHMGGNRLLLFARKPAPVQMTFCGYPGTTGLETIDFRLTDPYLDPPEAGDAMYAERSIRLAASFWCYQPTDDSPAVRALPALESGKITFGCLNNFCKINDGVFSLWARTMQAIPDSRLLLLAPAGSARQRVLEKMKGQGIDAARIEFVDHQPRRQYLETYSRVDIALDTFPYNGHMTSLDGFWMGVPVVTLIGQTAVGRAGWSQLSNLGLAELAAREPVEFVKIASDLGCDLPRLSCLRATLRQRMQASPLMDAAGFARAVEGAYEKAWRE